MKRKHTLSEKHPLLSMLLSVAAATLVCFVPASISSSDFVQYLLISASGILCLLAQKWWLTCSFRHPKIVGRVAANKIPHPAVADFGVNLEKYGLKTAQKQVKSGDKMAKFFCRV